MADSGVTNPSISSRSTHDTESLIKTENPNEANVSISLAVIDNHERATLVFTGSNVDPLISYSLKLLNYIYIGALADFDFSSFNNGEGTILETKHMYYTAVSSIATYI